MNETQNTETVTTKELNDLSAKIDGLRRQEAEASYVKKNITVELESAEAQMLELLDKAGLKNYRSPHGLASISFRSSVRVPATPEAKALFFNYLKEQGDFDNLITVNSMTLNSYYKEKMAHAIEIGQESFEIPGLEQITVTPILSFRKA